MRTYTKLLKMACLSLVLEEANLLSLHQPRIISHEEVRDPRRSLASISIKMVVYILNIENNNSYENINFQKINELPKMIYSSKERAKLLV